MNFQVAPDPIEKLTLMGNVTGFEPAGDTPTTEVPACFTPAGGASSVAPSVKERRQQEALRASISLVTTPTGKMPVLKTMMTTACERNCFYCPFRAGRSQTRRITFRPDEMAKAFDQLQRAKLVNGLFLSSGIINGGATAQDKIIETADILRRKYGYRGYIHLKIMPGAEYDQVVRAMQLADRVSINLEGPTPQRLQALAPKKEFWQELLLRLRWVESIRKQGWVRAGAVTQFVVGAVGDTDLELLSLSEKLYRQIQLKRVYFSPFHPVMDTPFENRPSTSPLRAHRLYQASFLLRDYAWDVEDLPFDEGQNLRLDVDPKRAWADLHLRNSPIEVNRADRQTLLRIPGIGPRSAQRILHARARGRLTDLSHLRALGVRNPAQAAPYILLNGKRPQEQLGLFEAK